jgi:hypothetical protein
MSLLLVIFPFKPMGELAMSLLSVRFLLSHGLPCDVITFNKIHF